MGQIKSERYRQKLHRLIDGNQNLIHFAYHFNHFVHAETMADYLLRAGLTGKRLEEWLIEKHNNSVLHCGEWIAAQLSHSAQRRTKVGRDYAL
jgi:hypothetical protein